MTRHAVAMAGLVLPGVSWAAESGGVDTGALVRLTLGLAAVLAVIVALAWAMRRMGRFTGGAAGRLQVLGAVSVGQRERVVLLQAGDRQLLLGVSPGAVRTLHVFDEPIAPAPGEAGETAGFAARLRGAMGETERS